MQLSELLQWLSLGQKTGTLLIDGHGVEKRVEELAAVETRDNGSSLRSMRNSVMPRVAHNFHFFADQLLALHEDDLFDALRAGAMGFLTKYEPDRQNSH
mgnify:CR=1 FL=1